MSTVRSIGKVLLGLTGLTTIAGSSALVVDQLAADREASNQTKIEKTIGDLKLELIREREAREELTRNSAAQARLLDQTQNTANDALTANDDLSGRLDDSEQTMGELRTTIEDLNRRLGLSIGMEQVAEIVNRAAPAAVNISYKDADGDEKRFSGSILKANGRRYLLTIAHGHQDVAHWLNQELTINLFNGFTFKMRPRPLEDGSIQFLHSDSADLALSELPPDIDARIPDHIGLEIRGPSEPPRYSEPIAVIGNPAGLKNSVNIGFVRHPGRYVILDSRLYANQAQVTQLDGGNSGGPIISLRDGKLIAISGWVRPGQHMTHGFGSNNVNIANLIDRVFRIPIMTPEDRLHIESMRLAERFQFPTPLCPMPLGNFIPVANEPTEIANARVIEAMSGFFMPTPLNPVTLENLVPKEK